MYTASYAFFEAIWDAGITQCFVNLGSDHPSLIEAMVKAQRNDNGKFPRIITCPNEMVAMSMADGYARLTGKPQCVIIHVDVGTQGLGAAVHNASVGRAPVLLFAGLSPFTMEGEHRGSRTEYIHWLQDVPDQKQIVSQYCRYSAEIKTGANIKQMVNRALQFATSDPQGPVYLCAAREIMEAEIEPYTLQQSDWKPVELGGLPQEGVDEIAEAFLNSKRPLVISGYGGRKCKFLESLVKLADRVKGLQVLDCGGSDLIFPTDNPACAGMTFGDDNVIKEADVIVVVDCDVPWIPTRCKPNKTATVFHIDVDPLKQQMPLFYIAASRRYRADATTSINQICSRLDCTDVASVLARRDSITQEKRINQEHEARNRAIDEAAQPCEDGSFGTGYLCKTLRELCPENTLWVVEAVTNTIFAHNNIKPTIPGSWINCGGGGLGWSGGGALGIKLASDAESAGAANFSVYWISMRYNLPILTIVLNNNGWNAPRRSLLLVHPDGLGSTATNEEINIAFNPTPDYAGIAKAAACGKLFTGRVSTVSELETVIKDGIVAVKEGRSAVIDCKVVPGC